MRKINVGYAGDHCSVFFSPKHRRFLVYHPENDREFMHQEFGGSAYYTSCTGLTGAGYLEVTPEDVLIRFGFYRADCVGPGHQKKAEVGMSGGSPIWGYFPVRNGGADYRYPVVFTDGQNVLFEDAYYLSPEKLAEILSTWKDSPEWEDSREFSYSWVDLWGNNHEKWFCLRNPHKLRGVNALRFADLREAQEAAREIFEDAADAKPWQSYLRVVNAGDALFEIDIWEAAVKRFTRKEFPPDVNGWNTSTRQENLLLAWKQANNFEIAALLINLEDDQFIEEDFSAFTFTPEAAFSQLAAKLRQEQEAAC